MSEVIIPTQLTRKFNLTLRFLVPPGIVVFLVIIIIFIPIPTLSIILTLLFIPSGLLVTLLVRQLHQKHTRHLGRLGRSHGLSRRRLVD